MECREISLGEVNMIIQMGPTEFSAQFQFLDIDTSYKTSSGKALYPYG